MRLFDAKKASVRHSRQFNTHISSKQWPFSGCVELTVSTAEQTNVFNWRFLCRIDAFFIISSSFIFYIKVFILQLYFSTSICKWIFNQFKPRAVSTGASVNLSSQCNFGVKINGPSGSFASLAVKFFDRFWNEHFLWSHRNWRKEIEVWGFAWFW